MANIFPFSFGYGSFEPNELATIVFRHQIAESDDALGGPIVGLEIPGGFALNSQYSSIIGLLSADVTPQAGETTPFDLAGLRSSAPLAGTDGNHGLVGWINASVGADSPPGGAVVAAEIFGLDLQDTLHTGDDADLIAGRAVVDLKDGYEANAYGIRATEIDTGAGDDLIGASLVWQSSTRSPDLVAALTAQSIDTGSGDDRILAQSEGVGSYRQLTAMVESIATGEGDDVVALSNHQSAVDDGGDVAAVVSGSVVDISTGAGSDLVRLESRMDIVDPDQIRAVSVPNGSQMNVSLGSGNDVLDVIATSLQRPDEASDYDLANPTTVTTSGNGSLLNIDGGDGADTVRFQIHSEVEALTEKEEAGSNTGSASGALLDIDLGAGSDRLLFDVHVAGGEIVTAIGTGGATDIRMGGGNDLFRMDILAETDSGIANAFGFAGTLDLGGGNDRFIINAEATGSDPASSVLGLGASSIVMGGDGFDYFDIGNFSSVGADAPLIDGGNHLDTLALDEPIDAFTFTLTGPEAGTITDIATGNELDVADIELFVMGGSFYSFDALFLP